MRRRVLVASGVVALLLGTLGLAVPRWFGTSARPARPPAPPTASESAPGPVLESRVSDAPRIAPPAEPVDEGRWRVRLVVHHHYDAPGLAGATVRVTDAEGRLQVLTTDVEGRVTVMGLPPGPIRVTASAEGFATSGEETLRREWLRGHAHRISLDAACTVEGSVVAAETGRPLEGAAIALHLVPYGMDPHKRATFELERLQASAVSDARGAFRLDGVSRDRYFGLRVLTASAPGRRAVWKVLAAGAEARGQIVRLPFGVASSGVVLLPDGRPAAGARVVAGLIGSWGSPIGADEVELPRRLTSLFFLAGEEGPEPDLEDAYGGVAAVADLGGRFSLEGLGLRERYSLVANLAGHAPSERVVVAASSETPTTPVTLRLRPAVRIVARVVDEVGRPWPGVDVGIQPEGPAYAPDVQRDRTSAEGQVVADGQPPGAYEVRMHQPACDDTNPRFRGLAIPRTEGEDWLRQVVRGESGTVEATFHLAGRAPEPKVEPTVSDEEPPPRGLATPRTPTLRLRIAVPVGVPPPAQVRLHGHSQTSSSSSSTGSTEDWKPGPDGTLLVEWAQDPSWVFTLDVTADGFRPQSHVVDLGGAPLLDLGVLTLDPGVTLDVPVRYADGSPVPQARFRAAFTASGATPPVADWWGHAEGTERVWEHEGATDASGRLRIGGLVVGHVRLTCSDPRILPVDVVRRVPDPRTPSVVAARGAVLRVLVVDEHGVAYARASVDLEPPPPTEDDPLTRYTPSAATDIEGRAVLRVPTGTQTIAAVARRVHEAPTARAVVGNLVEGEEREVRLVLPRP